MGLIMVRLALWNGGAQKQYPLRAVHRLGLTPLIHSEHQGLVRAFTYQPAISRTLAANSGTVATLKLSTRCGCNP